MTKSFGSLVFTPAVKALQERYGSRRQYARLEQLGEVRGGLGPDEKEYLGERDTFYMASLGESGWPYVQHRGGPKGFLKVINRVALIVVDYPRQLRLKLLGRAEIFEGEQAKDWLSKVRDSEYRAVTERVYVIRIEAFDWNCQQHIIPRYTEEEIRDVLEPVEKQMRDLQQANEEFRKRLAKSGGQAKEPS